MGNSDYNLTSRAYNIIYNWIQGQVVPSVTWAMPGFPNPFSWVIKWWAKGLLRSWGWFTRTIFFGDDFFVSPQNHNFNWLSLSYKSSIQAVDRNFCCFFWRGGFGVVIISGWIWITVAFYVNPFSSSSIMGWDRGYFVAQLNSETTKQNHPPVVFFLSWDRFWCKGRGCSRGLPD